MTAPNTDTPAVAWRSVPERPTEDMLNAGADKGGAAVLSGELWPLPESVGLVWAAMLAAAPAPDPSNLQNMQTAPDDLAMREAVAREIALHGLGTTDGEPRTPHPASLWTREEWDRRILTMIPGAAEEKCYRLADAILSLFRSTERTGG